MTKISELFGRFHSNNQGNMAIEFAFVFPIMAAAYLFLADVNLAINDNRRVADIANSTAQVAADYPDYSKTTRLALQRSLDAYRLFLNGRDLKVQIASLSKDPGNTDLTQVFVDTLANDAADAAAAAGDPLPAEDENWWQDELEQINYVDGDNVILVRAQIDGNSYVSKFFVSGTTVSATAQTQSYNSRTYLYSNKETDVDHYNWQK